MGRNKAKKKTTKTKATKTANESGVIATVVNNIAQASDSDGLPTLDEVYALLNKESMSDVHELAQELMYQREELYVALDSIQSLANSLKERVAYKPEGSALPNSWSSLVGCAMFLTSSDFVCAGEQYACSLLPMPCITDDQEEPSPPHARLLPGLDGELVACVADELKVVYEKLLAKMAFTLLRAMGRSATELRRSCEIIVSVRDSLSAIDGRIAALNRTFDNEREPDEHSDAE